MSKVLQTKIPITFADSHFCKIYRGTYHNVNIETLNITLTYIFHFSQLRYVKLFIHKINWKFYPFQKTFSRFPSYERVLLFRYQWCLHILYTSKIHIFMDICWNLCMGTRYIILRTATEACANSSLKWHFNNFLSFDCTSWKKKYRRWWRCFHLLLWYCYFSLLLSMKYQ